MKLKKSLIALIALGATGLVLTGCTNSSHKTVHHESSSSVSKSSRPSSKKAKSHKNTKSNKKSTPTVKSSTSKSHRMSLGATKSNNVKHNSSNSSSDSSLPTVNLGNGVVAHEDHGAGQTYLSFSANGHNFLIHGSNFGNGNQIAINKARSLAANANKLPASQKTVRVNTAQ